MTNLTKLRRQFTAQQKLEAIELCLSENLSWRAVAQRLGLHISSLAKWVRQVQIDRGDFGPPEHGQLTSEERAELAQLQGLLQVCPSSAGWGSAPTVSCAGTAPDPWPPSPPLRQLLQAI